MQNGYQIIELEALDALVTSPLHQEFAVAVLAWLIPQVSAALDIPDIVLDIVRVTYFGSYPALAVRYHNPDIPDLESKIETIANGLLNKKSARELVTWISQSEMSWVELTGRIMNKPG